MNINDALTLDVPLWALAAYYIFSAAVGSLPAPAAESGLFYRWFFGFANSLAANLARARLALRREGNGKPAPEPETK